MQLHTYLNFDGRCLEAFTFYEQHLGGSITTVMTHADQPGDPRVPAEWRDKILYAALSIAGTELRGSDVPGAQPMRSAYLNLGVDSIGEAERIYAGLSEGGQVFMPMEETFFAHRFGMLRDRFGVSWMIMCQKQPASAGADA